MAAPFRWYYRLTRLLFGKNFVPYAMTVDDEIHPISQLILDNYGLIRMIFTSDLVLISTAVLVLSFYF